MSNMERKPKFLNSQRTFTLKNYTTIDHRIIGKVGMSYREWIICENIQFWCEYEETGTVAITRAEMGELFGLSAERCKYIVRDLVNRKFLKVSKNYHLAVASKWKKMMDVNGSPIPKNFLEDNTKLEASEAPTTPKEPKTSPTEKPTTEAEEEQSGFPYFEEEFGLDEHSRVDRPSLNQVRKKAMNLHKQKKISKELAEEIATSFFRKKEKERWVNTSDFFSSLKRYIDGWKRNADKYPDKYPEREKKIVTPTSNEEMRLFLKQMSDEDRAELTFNKGGELIVINSMNGMPVMQESGEFLGDAEYENFMKFLLGNFKNGKLRLKRGKK